MNNNFSQAALLILFLAGHSWAGGSLKQITKSATQAIDVEKEIKAFVESLIDKDPQIKTQYQRLAAPVKEEAGTRFNPGEWWVLLWQVPNHSWEVNNVPNTDDSESVYLVGQALWSGAVDSRWLNQNVVAQVRSVEHQTSTPGRLKVLTDKITLTFEGFVDLKPELQKTDGVR